MSASPQNESAPVFIVGIAARHSEYLIRVAAEFAGDIGASIVFAHAEINSALVEREPASRRTEQSLHPDVDEEMSGVSAGISQMIESAIGIDTVRWSLRMLGGDPAKALARLSTELNARMIVVGAPRQGITHRAEDILSGSVGTWLARHQPRPVLVVPEGNA